MNRVAIIKVANYYYYKDCKDCSYHKDFGTFLTPFTCSALTESE